jgi:hypothetical protein
MSEVLTIDDIKTRYPAEYVLLGEPQKTDTLELLAGRVLWHGPDREELYRKANELRPKDSAILFTGPMPKNLAVLL